MNTAKNMSAYLDSAFSFEKIRAELLAENRQKAFKKIGHLYVY
ncbi:hypothetical protein [uncultured Veillonella sp.]|jgi:hypothetical protein|nr:hypothetical protein [uncultured Veillonella sp.]